MSLQKTRSRSRSRSRESSLTKPPLPLLFAVTSGGTLGDRKPLVILSVLAAAAAPLNTLVTLVYRTEHAKFFRFLPIWADKMLGQNWTQKLIVMELSEDALEAYVESQRSHKFVITTSTYGFESPQANEIFFSFGDTQGMLWKSYFLLDNKKDKRKHTFGPVFLPPDNFYSNSLVLQKLREFRQTNISRKIIAMAGSLRVPFYIDEIVAWLEDDAKKKQQLHQPSEFAFLLINYIENDGSHAPKFYSNPWRHVRFEDKGKEHPWMEDEIRLTQYIASHSKDILKLNADEYIELEDVLLFVDIIITNCGAGSITAPIAAGCPQVCNIAGIYDNSIPGDDKLFNDNLLQSVLILGPTIQAPLRRRQSKLILSQLLQQFSQNWEKYTHNTQLVQKILIREFKRMQALAFQFFYRLQTNAAFQQKICHGQKEDNEFFDDMFINDTVISSNLNGLKK